MTSRHALICFLQLIANCSVMLESSKLLIVNASILYMDHLISTYLFLHLTIKGSLGLQKDRDLVCIQRVISLVNWNDVFRDESLNKILLNKIRNFISNKVTEVDYKYLN